MHVEGLGLLISFLGFVIGGTGRAVRPFRVRHAACKMNANRDERETESYLVLLCCRLQTCAVQASLTTPTL